MVASDQVIATGWPYRRTSQYMGITMVQLPSVSAHRQYLELLYWEDEGGTMIMHPAIPQ
ncbi:hypothetical protein [Chitinivorax sp. B]|uniref:hypothetical protein n=1 Tax=Chitinivorax sp. B TaxID=2502235 RepID=UPI0014855B23|nr:hypothetical protein [Chitinivorax sp. B]